MSTVSPPLAAFAWGILSASSLPLGACVGLLFKVHKTLNSALMAFGAGALLFAVTIELYAHAIDQYEDGLFETKGPMIMLGVGSVLGALVFSVSSYLIENQGGFLRQLALKHRWFIWRRKRAKAVYEYEHQHEHEQPPETETAPGSPPPELQPTDDLARSASAVSVPDPDAPIAFGSDEPLLRRPVLERSDSISDNDSMLDRSSIEFDFSDPKKLAVDEDEHGEDANVGIAIWLGILIDAFPESLVIGILGAQDSGISVTFILGVFLANFPEALSSSVIMKRAKMKWTTIMLMWTSVMLITGAGAALGAIAFAGEENEAQQLASKTVEGLAAGAMLVVIAETVLPEAFRHAGKLVGFSTLVGFLAAYVVKLSEE